MKKTVLQVLSVLLVAMLAFALCACNTDSGDAQATASPTATQKSTATKAPATTAPATTAPATTAPAATTEATTDATATATTAPSSSATATVAPTEEPEDDLYDTDYKAVSGKAVIDGKIDDAWNKAEVVSLDNIKKVDSDESDTIIDARMMWDKDGFYFLFEITDEEISQVNGTGDYQNDGIYLYISEDLQEGTGAFTDFVDGTYQFALISDALEMLPRYGVADDVENCASAYKTTDTGMIIEFYYQPAYAELAVGTQMFLDFQYNDAANGSRLCAFGWYNDTDENARTDLWGVVKLVETAE